MDEVELEETELDEFWTTAIETYYLTEFINYGQVTKRLKFLFLYSDNMTPQSGSSEFERVFPTRRDFYRFIGERGYDLPENFRWIYRCNPRGSEVEPPYETVVVPLGILREMTVSGVRSALALYGTTKAVSKRCGLEILNIHNLQPFDESVELVNLAIGLSVVGSKKNVGKIYNAVKEIYGE